MKKHIITILTLFCVCLGYAQSDTTNVDSIVPSLLEMPMTMELMSMPVGSTVSGITPASPNVASLSKYVDMPVGLYNGIPNINIPIYEINDHDLKVPVSLSYHASGISVSEEASWVGLGWNLNIGGAVTTLIRGAYDGADHANLTFEPINLSALQQCVPWDDYSPSSTYNGYDVSQFTGAIPLTDTEPDLHIFSFLGYSGKFIHNGSKYITLDRQNLKIEKLINGWKIMTPEGITAEFTKVEETTVDFKLSSKTYHLTQLTSPAGAQIDYEYDSEGSLKLSSSIWSQTEVIYNDGYSSNIWPASQTISPVNVFPVLSLKKVTFSNGYLLFTKESRDDIINAKRLGAIEVYIEKGSVDELVKKYNFSYNYFTSCSSNGFDTDLTKSHLSKRLKLLSVSEDAGAINKSYEFEYNSEQLPAKLSYAQDYWGYYNGKTSNTTLIPDFGRFKKPNDAIWSIPSYTGADREPDENKMKAASLIKITYPTKGYTTFEYQANTYSNFRNEVNDPSVKKRIGKGLRVKKISNYEANNDLLTSKTYNYEYVQNGKTYSYGKQMSAPYFFRHISRSTKTPIIGSCCTNTSGFDGIILYSNSVVPISNSAKGSGIGYDQVEVINGANGGVGKSVSVFTNDVPYNEYYEGRIPGIPAIERSKNGQIVQQRDSIFITSDTYRIHKKTSYGYKFDNYEEMYWCIKPEEQPNPESSGCTCDPIGLYLHFYAIHIYNGDLEGISETFYDPELSTPTVLITKEKDFVYNEGKLLKSIKDKTSTNSIIETKYYYPHDYTSVDDNIPDLITNNIIGKPIDVRTYNGTQLISGTQTKYNVDGQPIETRSAEINGTTDIAFEADDPYSFTTKATYTYNTNKNLKQVSATDNINTVYLWDATGNYVMAKVENADYNDIDQYDNQPYTTNSETLHSNITGAASGALVTTFTHKPLVGIAQQTDPAGRTTKYVYDDFGRLKYVKDQDGNIVNKHEYHYAGQSNE